MEEKNYNTPPSVSNICHACLSQNRNTFPLGEYRDIFARLTFSYISDNQHTKLCWECMAILRKFYIFKRKCHIAQKILCSEWSHNKPNCLSNLSTTAANISYITINYECNRNSDVKSEATSDHYIKDYDQTFDYLNETEPDYIDSINYDDVTNTVEEPQIQNESDIKHFDGEIKVDCEFDTFNTKGDNSVVNTESSCQKSVVKVKSEETEEKITVNVPPNKRRLSRKDIKGHFYIVKKDLKSTGYVKVKIEESKMEKLRHSERVSEFFQKKTYKCDDCISYFPRQKNLSQHKLQVHDESLGKYTCDICSARSGSKSRLAAHVARHYVALRCATCAFVCYSGQRMRSHVKQHWRSVQCVHCTLNFANIGQFFKHYKESHYVFVCDNCGKRCRSKYTLEKHMRHHYEPNICLICNKVYKTRNSLRNHCELKHERASAGELAYCVQCDKQFENAALYRRHVAGSAAHATERGQGRRNKQVRCPLCEKVYSRKTYMMNHYRYVHMKQSKHYCADCDKHFLNRTRYVEHRKYQHEGKLKVKDKMCNICGRGFAANRTLRNHIRTHSGERPYECEHCDASFTQKHCLVSHVKYIHLKNKRRALSSWVK